MHKIEEAIELQSDFAKSAYEDIIAQATKVGNLYSDLAKDAFRLTDLKSPVSAPVAASSSKAPVTAKAS